MVKHKSHSISMPVEAGDAFSTRGDEVVDGLKQDIGQHGAFQMSPQAFDEVQTRGVRRQPEHGDLIGVSLQPGIDRLGMMKSSVVAHQTNPAARVGGHQRDKERDKLRAALFVGHGVGDLAGGEIHSAVHDFLFVLARRGDFGLSARRCPPPRERRMTMDLDYVLENQRFGGVGFQGFFSSERAVFRPFRRPTRRVCLSWCAWDDETKNPPDAAARGCGRR
jgi:hypothetical protein